VRVGEQSFMQFSFRVVTLTPLLSRKPGEGVNGLRTYKGLFGAERAESAEMIYFKRQKIPKTNLKILPALSFRKKP
jgi:hypothetical protein